MGCIPPTIFTLFAIETEGSYICIDNLAIVTTKGMLLKNTVYNMAAGLYFGGFVNHAVNYCASPELFQKLSPYIKYLHN